MIDSVRKIADAVLYEGFLLFPYAKDDLKNRMPFQFGVVMPLGYRDTTEPSAFRSEAVLCHGDAPATLSVLLRFLQTGDEIAEREFCFEVAPGRPAVHRFSFGEVYGTVAVSWHAYGAASRFTLDVRNEARVDANADRNAALRKALIGAHAVLEAFNGEFASLLDPPESLRALVDGCRNERWFPVLAGEGERGARCSRLLLISPIVLYDFPKVAEASLGPTFDGTEIDELLALSVASLSDEERARARAAHPAVAGMVDRAEALTVAPGWHVRVHPKGRADVWDDIVAGKTARVVDVKTDVDGKRYVGVLFDDDPASEMHEWYGRSFYYGTDEVERLS